MVRTHTHTHAPSLIARFFLRTRTHWHTWFSWIFFLARVENPAKIEGACLRWKIRNFHQFSVLLSALFHQQNGPNSSFFVARKVINAHTTHTHTLFLYPPHQWKVGRIFLPFGIDGVRTFFQARPVLVRGSFELQSAMLPLAGWPRKIRLPFFAVSPSHFRESVSSPSLTHTLTWARNSKGITAAADSSLTSWGRPRWKNTTTFCFFYKPDFPPKKTFNFSSLCNSSSPH